MSFIIFGRCGDKIRTHISLAPTGTLRFRLAQNFDRESVSWASRFRSGPIVNCRGRQWICLPQTAVWISCNYQLAPFWDRWRCKSQSFSCGTNGVLRLIRDREHFSEDGVYCPPAWSPSGCRHVILGRRRKKKIDVLLGYKLYLPEGCMTVPSMLGRREGATVGQTRLDAKLGILLLIQHANSRANGDQALN
ncbi:hypothetical protein BX600DRAFT_91571 [Xylariales sp. PMI_506]|nr:hypothetical protein BX600DRAFT_91571 [Xylariales sp. PMI_506]